jgi:hypothetical protein
VGLEGLFLPAELDTRLRMDEFKFGDVVSFHVIEFVTASKDIVGYSLVAVFSWNVGHEESDILQ